MKRTITIHSIRSPLIPERLRLAVAPDLHSTRFDDLLDTFIQCDAVLIPGDLVDRHRRNNSFAMRFLQEVPEMVPVFYSLGNHEVKFRQAEEYLARVKESKVILLQDDSRAGTRLVPYAFFPPAEVPGPTGSRPLSGSGALLRTP